MEILIDLGKDIGEEMIPKLSFDNTISINNGYLDMDGRMFMNFRQTRNRQDQAITKMNEMISSFRIMQIGPAITKKATIY